jgi:hypothetical protein
MVREDFCEKCIIVHFLGVEKDKKSYQRRDAEYAEKRFEEVGTRDSSRDGSGWDELTTGAG